MSLPKPDFSKLSFTDLILAEMAKSLAHCEEPSSDITHEKLCPAARIDAGEHFCKLLVRPRDNLPRGLWSWCVYIDGNVNWRAPGSTRKDPTPLYALIFKGQHRIVIRTPFEQGAPRIESNTVLFEVKHHDVVLIDVFWRDGRPHLELSEARLT